MSDPTFAYIWEYRVRLDSIAEFRSHFGPGGSWVRLYRQSPGYIETRLYRDAREHDRYITVDRWESLDSFRKFRTTFASQYEQLDRSCRSMTVSDRHFGTFDMVAESGRDPSFMQKRRRSDR